MKRIVALCLAAALATGAPALAQAAAPVAPAKPAAPAGSRGQAVEGVVALVNDEVISQSDVRNRMRIILLSFPGKPDEATLREAQAKAIEGLIEEKIQLREFHKLVKDHDIEDAEIDQRIAGMARQSKMEPDKFLAELAAEGINLQSLRDQVKADIAWSTIIRGRFARNIRVSELRIDEMMERVKESLDKPQVRLGEIFLYAPDQESRNNALKTAETLKQQIEQGAQFEAVAQQFSAAPSASAGGDLGWLSPGDKGPEIEEAIKNAKPPALLPPIESEGGVYLIALLGRREPIDPNAVMLKMKQISAKGDGAAAKLQAIKSKAKTCSDAVTAAQGVDGVTVVDMNDVALQGMSDTYKAALQPVKAGESTDLIDAGDSQLVLFVCERAAADAAVPTRDQIRDRLFDTEISMLADRYLRDLKREATIVRR
jgi:peptidyl-prolyl cis-trans isomerase SurA